MVVALRDVADGDLPVFFEHQRDPEAAAMAAFRPRELDAFLAHWERIRRGETSILRAVVADGVVVGNVVSWHADGQRYVGYWIGREHWGRGIATAALAAFVAEIPTRPLHARVATSNVASARVLQKCGFEIAGEETGDDGVTELLLALL
jgi:RimJ/RimL family protein N-acetyltransferase